jgi:hypothetical protein
LWENIVSKRDDDPYILDRRILSALDDKLHDYGDIRDYNERANAERITRLEEQMKTAYNATARIEDKLDRLVEQGQMQNVNLAQNSVKISTGERLAWLVVSAAVGLLIYYAKAVSSGAIP